MPIIKTPSGADQPAYYTISQVEIVRVYGEYQWRAAFSIWPSVEASRTPGAKPIATGVDTSVPLAMATDVFAAYEAAAVLTPNSNFYGGEVVADTQAYTPVEWARITQWGKVKIQRDATLAGGVDTPYGRFDTDLTSIVNVIGAASIAAQAPETWSDQWILADRTVVTLNKAQLMEVGAILADFRSRTYRRGDELYNALQSAPTLEAVRAITWSPGVA